MDWLNLHTSTLDGPEVLGSDPTQRATWLMLLRYCIGQENSGTILASASWNDRKWQQLVRVTKREVSASSDLWSWSGEDLIVWGYPIEKEQEILIKRETAKLNGRAGGRPKNPRKTNVGYSPETQAPNSEKAEGERKGKGMEREGEGRALHVAPPVKSEDIFDGPKSDLPPATDAHEWTLRVQHLPWAKAIAAVAKIGAGTWRKWEPLIDKHGLPAVVAAAQSVPATIRWPDQTEEVLRKAHGQAPLGASVAQRTIKL